MAWADISKWGEVKDLFYILVAVLIVDVVGIFLFRYYPDFFGCVINQWYDKYGLAAVLSDITVIVIGFLIARYIYTRFLQKTYGWSIWLFIAVVVVVQFIHDIIFYKGVILPIPKGHNAMMDTFKAYAVENGGKILIADAIMMIASSLIGSSLKTQGDEVTSSIGILFVYALTYILYTKPVRGVC